MKRWIEGSYLWQRCLLTWAQKGAKRERDHNKKKKEGREEWTEFVFGEVKSLTT